ncbi:DUF4062 domain-containing protein [Elizabethkingia anophelis]|uniref:DUF4062 domain-containing protein n=1 Tax=Elizabethkingia anophelis TaxID=1117645 RepID=UPI0016299F2A|nr:DUF4062 domain-containing protein [Elizabethkingia anophelis]MCT3922710.1 DUF4062 domain-containing protein [Elizabethkingia anophelis]MCT4061648.1 DUF4062 domain-containing protein [Elizabethkingia anophelis]MCT4107796.1 DUF4062 domain-containing protein [Elizabethkingia anophelis]MCT4320958.1 DUF4062 domain-containing protein [Elizabethkingia anophelis]HAY3534689.1 DUF4062 domain-containing protein [Elizabethkingia anophelis]
MPAERPIKIMLSSTVYHFKNEIEQIYATLTGMGYEVLCSHMGTIYNIPGQPPLVSCLKAVEDCDFFFGIVLPFYGSGITFQEFEKAIELDKPRGFLAHSHVVFAKQLLKQKMFYRDGRRKNFKLKKTNVLDDLRVIDMYNIAIGEGLPLGNRRWTQEFYRYPLDGAPFVVSQFGDERFIRDLKNLRDGE